MTGAFRELPFDPDDVHAEAARVIIDAMDLDLDEKALVRLLCNTRHAHRMVLSDWKRRNDPGWQPKKRLQDNWPRDEPTYDYGKDAGVGFDEHRWIDPRSGKTYFGWEAWWRENWGRARSNPGRFRGTDIAAPPLVAIYYLCNRWWRETLGTPFRPDFRAIDLKVPDAKNLPELNDAARLFLMVAQDAGGPAYNCDLCSRVHDANYRRLWIPASHRRRRPPIRSRPPD